MDETKVQISNDVLLDIGTHSDWYISVIRYDNESVNVELRRKIDRNNKWWVAEQIENCSEKPNNCEDKPMKTTDYCDICNHKGCEYCISDSRNPYCVPSNYESKDEPKTSGVVWTEDAIKNEPTSYTIWASTDETQTERNE